MGGVDLATWIAALAHVRAVHGESEYQALLDQARALALAAPRKKNRSAA